MMDTDPFDATPATLESCKNTPEERRSAALAVWRGAGRDAFDVMEMLGLLDTAVELLREHKARRAAGDAA